MSRFAAIDIGTNSILLLVADITNNTLTPVVDEAVITRLGKGVDSAGCLDEAAVERSVDAVRRFAGEARALGVNQIFAGGTSALRDAGNAARFLDPAREILGSDVRIIAGEDEARLSWTSVVSDSLLSVDKPVLMADVGGGSTELVIGDEQHTTLLTSIDMGAVRLTERCLKSDPYTPSEMKSAKQEAEAAFAGILQSAHAKALVGIGGTVVNLACIAQEGAAHTAVHGVRVSLASVSEIAERLGRMTLEERRTVPGLEPQRADVITAGAIIFQTLLEGLGVDEVVTSTRGARFGMIWEAVAGRWQ